MIINSQIVEATLQANGSFNVIERHTASDGRIFDVVYNAPAEMDLNAVMAARAQRINADLAMQEQVADAADAGYPPLHNVTFKLRFTQEERIAIRAARATDPYVDDLYDLMDSADGIYPDHPMVQAALGYFVTAGLITAERAAEIGA